MLLVVILVFTVLIGLLSPWWWMIAVISFVAALIFGRSASQAVWSGFGGVFLAWCILALMQSMPNDNVLATRVATLFHLPHWLLLLVIMGLVGSLVGGTAAASGFLVRKLFIHPALK